MRSRTWTRAKLASVAACGMLLVACTPDGTGGGEETDDEVAAEAGVPVVSPPPSRSTPFCQAMLDLDEELPDDPAVDARDQILIGYRDAQPLVPAEIAAEFAAVIEGLETGTVVTLPPVTHDGATPAPAPPDATDPSGTVTEDTFFEEGYLPDDNPAIRVNEYIDFACRGVQNNPGPPPTQPGAPPSTEAS